MPGRQAHGRPLMGAGSGTAGNKRRQQKQKAKSKSRAQDAFSIANKELGGDRHKLTPRNRELDADLGAGKRRRGGDGGDEDDEDDEDEDEDDAPPRKRRAHQTDGDEDIEYGSDSSGNEWRVGVGEDDEDSDIDSDEAFGESDEEKFQGYAFSGSTKKKRSGQDEDDEESDLESLGSDAIDLADALDQSMSDDDADQGEDDEESDESGSEESEESEDSEDDVSESGVNDWVKKFSGAADEDEEEITAPKKSKIDLNDLGLLGGLDPSLKKSLKLMSKEEKSSKPQKLEVPLARRQQARLDRAAAYEQANKTLDRWQETVKQNRRADHLVFPLAQTETGLVRHDNTEIAPLDSRINGNELERTIMGIVEESGLVAKTENEPKEYLDENGEPITRKEFWANKRRERELKSREEARAKRIKKIKSKAYHRVHRKEREKNELKEQEALAAAGLIDSEEEREARDRQRAAERMGARHKDSKWAKMAKKGGLAVWDDSVRDGINDMARRDEELRRRVEGRGDGSDDDDDSDYSADSEDMDDKKRLLKELKGIDDVDEPSGPRSKLMNMPFMKKAENLKKQENDDLIKQIRRELDSDAEVSEPEPELDDIGRRQYGAPEVKVPVPAAKAKKEKPKKSTTDAHEDVLDMSKANDVPDFAAPTPRSVVIDETGGAWSTAAPAKPSRNARKQKHHDSSVNVLELDSSAAVVKSRETAQKSKPVSKHATTVAGDSSDDDDEDRHLVQFRDQDLLDKAFGGLDVVAEFEAEKHAQEEEDDEKIIDNTLPGWGSWVGDGVSAKEKRRHQGRFLTKQDGIKKDKRKDAKLKNVIMNEKIIKKNNKYLASQLPHTFENVHQYERSLRLPVGPEWVTKKTHQDAVKPRVIIKQGIIAPMAKPNQ